MEWWSVHWLGWQSSMLICFVVFQPMSLPQLMGLTLAEIDAMTRSMGKIFTGTAGKLSLVRFIISRFAAFYVYHLAFYDKSTSLKVSLYSRNGTGAIYFQKRNRTIKICSRPISKIDDENRSLQIHHLGLCILGWSFKGLILPLNLRETQAYPPTWLSQEINQMSNIRCMDPVGVFIGMYTGMKANKQRGELQSPAFINHFSSTQGMVNLPAWVTIRLKVGHYPIQKGCRVPTIILSGAWLVLWRVAAFFLPN